MYLGYLDPSIFAKLSPSELEIIWLHVKLNLGMVWSIGRWYFGPKHEKFQDGLKIYWGV